MFRIEHYQTLDNLKKSTRGYCLFNLESAINFTSSSNIADSLLHLLKSNRALVRAAESNTILPRCTDN